MDGCEEEADRVEEMGSGEPQEEAAAKDLSLSHPVFCWHTVPAAVCRSSIFRLCARAWEANLLSALMMPDIIIYSSQPLFRTFPGHFRQSLSLGMTSTEEPAARG